MSNEDRIPVWSLGLDLSRHDQTIGQRDGSTIFNLGGFLDMPTSDIRLCVRDLIRTKLKDGPATADDSPEQIIVSFHENLHSAKLCLDNIDKIRTAMASFSVHIAELRGRSLTSPPYPPFEPQSQRNVVRYGNVELAVVEGYLRDPAGTKSALVTVLSSLGSEEAMYARGTRSHHLDVSDQAWNIRRLMTNAGFYVSADLESAWKTLRNWTHRYINAMTTNYLANYNGALPFSFGIMRKLWEIDGTRISSVRHPNLFEVYPWMSGKDVLVLSPMAELVQEQAVSGRLWNLYTDYTVPLFAIRALPAGVSTWPNAPHSNWSETFDDMCARIDAAYADRPFDIFMASCGCYGIPICDYVRMKYGCQTLYIGNILHALFGIKQNSTRDFAQNRRNDQSWTQGRLGDIANVHRIDGGRYV